MKLLQKLKQYWQRTEPAKQEVIAAVAEKYAMPRPPSKGRVITKTKHLEYTPNYRTGGKIVKLMPKQLQQIKEAQEQVEADV